jgi:hypothetical protein
MPVLDPNKGKETELEQAMQQWLCWQRRLFSVGTDPRCRARLELG